MSANSLLYDDDGGNVDTSDGSDTEMHAPSSLNKERAQPTAKKFLSPLAWSVNATLHDIYRYIYENHNGDTDSVYNEWYKHASKFARNKTDTTVANGWHQSYNNVRVYANNMFGGSWQRGLQHHYSIQLRKMLNIPRTQPRRVKQNRAVPAIITSPGVTNAVSADMVVDITSSAQMTEGTGGSELSAIQRDTSLILQQLTAIVRGIDQTNHLLSTLCVRLHPMQHSSTSPRPATDDFMTMDTSSVPPVPANEETASLLPNEFPSHKPFYHDDNMSRAATYSVGANSAIIDNDVARTTSQAAATLRDFEIPVQGYSYTPVDHSHSPVQSSLVLEDPVANTSKTLDVETTPLPAEARQETKPPATKTKAKNARKPNKKPKTDPITAASSASMSLSASTSIYDVPRLGLKNHGTSCFMSCVILSMYATRPFRNAVLQLDDNTNEIVRALKDVFVEMRQTQQTMTKIAILTKRVLLSANTLFHKGYHDANEFLCYMLSSFSAFGDIRHPQLQHIVQSLFTGTHIIMKVCSNNKCNRTQVDLQQPFIQHELTPAKASSLTDLLARQPVATPIKSQEVCVCNGCEYVNNFHISELPPIFIIHLNRFAKVPMYFGQEQSMKITHPTEFPNELNMSPYVQNNGNDTSSMMYTLYAIVLHTGHPTRGHYVTCIRSVDDWVVFDDADTSVLIDSSVHRQSFKVNGVDAHPTILFYTLRNWSGWNTFNGSAEPIPSSTSLSTSSESIASVEITRVITQPLAIHIIAYGKLGKLHPDFIQAVPSGDQQRAIGVVQDGSCGRHAILVGTGTIKLASMDTTAQCIQERTTLIEQLSLQMSKELDRWAADYWIQTIPLQVRAAYWTGLPDDMITETTSLDTFKKNLRSTKTYVDFCLFYVAARVKNISFIVIRVLKHEKYGWNKRSIIMHGSRVCVIRHIPGFIGTGGHYEPIVNEKSKSGLYKEDDIFIRQLMLLPEQSDEEVGSTDLELMHFARAEE